MMNEKQQALLKEWFEKRFEMQEKTLWIGCNPDDPEMFKKQATEGFQLMIEFSNYTKEILNKIDEAWE